jgi:hypothetical protein
MTFLFRSGTLREKVAAILGATFEHASNLASFVFVYKLVLAAGRVAWRLLQLPIDDRAGHPAVGWHAFVAGCIGALHGQAMLFLSFNSLPRLCVHVDGVPLLTARSEPVSVLGWLPQAGTLCGASPLQ